MNYTVEWLPEAEDQLAALWSEAVDRNAVTDTTRQIEQMLGRNPEDLGEDRPALATRLLFVRPLAVLYRVDEPNRWVQVVSISWAGRPV